ncbi:MAG: HD domain-containing phosphohydrolase [Pseudomonadota bacterium]
MNSENRQHDPLALLEFREALTDRAPKIEHGIAALRRDLGDQTELAELLLCLHKMETDAVLCRVEFAVVMLRSIKTVLLRFQKQDISLSNVLAETILLAMDRLELAVNALCSNKLLGTLQLQPLLTGLEIVAAADAAVIEERAYALIAAVTGFRPRHNEAFSATESSASKTIQDEKSKRAEDLIFFRTLATQLENRSPLFKGRTIRVLRLAQETNREAAQKIDPIQLEAASYLHDIGMMFLPEASWTKVGHMSASEKLGMRRHPEYAAGILSRMPHWSAAAQMILEHHEMPDGAGYPCGLSEAQICSGAKLLAIVDAFEAVMLKHIHRGRNRSVLRAIAEINACDNQFSPEWIAPFNKVIRRTLEN